MIFTNCTTPSLNDSLPISNRPVARLSMRTTKRHFSTMSQYWKWLKPLGHVDNIIFSGFSFPGTKGGKKKRDDWSRADLNLFLERSEEHTSELQSLMRISYAVFCLKKTQTTIK